MSLDAVIFDMDGVLVDSEPMHLATTNSVLARYGVQVDAEFYERCTGMAEVPFFELLARRFRLPADPQALAEERVAASLRALEHDRLSPMEGAPECLRALRSNGRRVALASSSRRVQVDLVIRRLGLSTLLDASVSADDVARAKPAPDLFLEAARRLAVPPSRCIVVEDAVLGVAAARSAGMAVIALVRGGRDGALHIEHGALRTVAGLREVSPSLLNELPALRDKPQALRDKPDEAP